MKAKVKFFKEFSVPRRKKHQKQCAFEALLGRERGV